MEKINIKFPDSFKKRTNLTFLDYLEGTWKVIDKKGILVYAEKTLNITGNNFNISRVWNLNKEKEFIKK